MDEETKKIKYRQLLNNLNSIRSNIAKANQDLKIFISDNKETVLADDKMLNEDDILNIQKNSVNALSDLTDVIIPTIKKKI